ncbi:MAG: arginase family protein, partial [Myxococcota bacterium]
MSAGDEERKSPSAAYAGTAAENDQSFMQESLYGSRTEPAYAGALSYMRRRYTRDLSGVDFAVSGLPSDISTSNRPGARMGPRGIRAASAQLAFGAH